jgi:hypothetical protein
MRGFCVFGAISHYLCPGMGASYKGAKNYKEPEEL